MASLTQEYWAKKKKLGASSAVKKEEPVKNNVRVSTKDARSESTQNTMPERSSGMDSFSRAYWGCKKGRTAPDAAATPASGSADKNTATGKSASAGSGVTDRPFTAAPGQAEDRMIGRFGRGNVDLYNRPRYVQNDGSISTVNSISIEEDGKIVLIPTIGKDAQGRTKQMTDAEAIDSYHKSGEHLGIFSTEEQAEQYAERLHLAQEYRYGNEPKTEDAIDRNARANNILIDTPKRSAGVTGSGRGIDDWTPEEYRKYQKMTDEDIAGFYAKADELEQEASSPRIGLKYMGPGDPVKQYAEQISTVANKKKQAESIRSFARRIQQARNGGQPAEFDFGSYAGSGAKNFLYQIGHMASSFFSLAEEATVGSMIRLIGAIDGDDPAETESAISSLPFHKMNTENLDTIDRENAATMANIENIDDGALRWLAEKGYETAGSLGPAAVMAATAMASAPALAGASTETLASTAYLAENPGLVNTLSEGMSVMMRDPNYWSSFMMTVGPDYDEARQKGASVGQAMTYAVAAGLLNAAIEIGGPSGDSGIQGAFKNAAGGISGGAKEFVEKMIDEGKEEVLQGIVSRAMENLVTNANNPVFSVTDPNAILNPVTAAEEFAGGAVVSALLGPAQKTAAYFAQRHNYKAAGAAITEGRSPEQRGELTAQLLLVGLASDNAGVNSYALEMQKQFADTGALTDAQIGRLYAGIVDEIDQPGNWSAAEAVNTQEANRAAIADFASTVDKAGSMALQELYDGKSDPEAYIRDAMRVYQNGQKGLYRPGAGAGVLNQAQAEAMYLAGQADAETAAGVPQTQSGAPVAREIENALNQSEINRTSKDNNKNNQRIRAWLNENYPGLTVEFTNDKATGNVTVSRVISNETAQAENESRAASRQETEMRAEAEKRFYNRVKSFSGNDKLMRSIESLLQKDGITAFVSRSRSMVRSLSFYVEVETDDGMKTIKVSDHLTAGQQSPDLFIDITRMTSFGEVYDKIREFIAKTNGEDYTGSITRQEDANNGTERGNAVRAGSDGILSQGPGEQAGRVQGGTETAGGERRTATEARDPEREMFRAAEAGEKVKANTVISSASDGQKVSILNGTPTAATYSAEALADKHGLTIVLWGGGKEITTKSGLEVRASYDPKSKKITAMYDNAEHTAFELTQHEVMEYLLDQGTVTVTGILEAAKQYVADSKLQEAIRFYVAGYPSLTKAEATSELICDGGDHINQLRYGVEHGTLAGQYIELADVLDEVLDGIHRAASELTEGAFDVDPIETQEGIPDDPVLRDLIRQVVNGEISPEDYAEAFLKRSRELEQGRAGETKGKENVSNKSRGALNRVLADIQSNGRIASDRISTAERRAAADQDVRVSVQERGRNVGRDRSGSTEDRRTSITKLDTDYPENEDIRFSQKLDLTQNDVEAVQSIGEKRIGDLTGEELRSIEPFAGKMWADMGTKSPFFRAWFGDWRSNDQTPIIVVDAKAKAPYKAGKNTNNDTGRIISWGDTLKRETVTHLRSGGVAEKMLGNIDELVKNAVLLDTLTSSKSSKSKLNGTAFMHSFYVVVNDGAETSLLKLYVEEAVSSSGEDFTRAYDLKDIKRVAALTNGVLSLAEGLTDANVATIKTVADLFAAVKAFDNDFGPKPAGVAVNKDGTPMRVYHGTGAYIETFLPEYTQQGNDQYGSGYYLTTDEEEAKGYTTATLNGKPKLGGDENPNVIPAFTNIKNPIIVDAAETPNLYDISVSAKDAAKIISKHPDIMDAENSVLGDFFDEYWETGPKKWMIDRLASEYDWSMGTLETDLFLGHPEEFHAAVRDVTGHDGVQINFKNGKRHYIAWFSDQIKHATENMGTFSPFDNRIRFSTKMQPVSLLEQENKMLTEKLAEITKQAQKAQKAQKQAEYWKGQTKVTTRETATLREGDLKNLANNLIRSFEGTVKASDILDDLRSAGELILRGTDGKNELTIEAVREHTDAIARKIIDSAMALTNEDDVELGKEIKKILKQKMSISAYDAHDIPDFGQWRKRNFGRISVGIDNGGIPIDVAYQELSGMAPWLFPEDVTAPSDQIQQMAEAATKLRPEYANVYDTRQYGLDRDMAVTLCSNEILDGLLDESVRQTPPTYADRAEQRLGEERAKSAERLAAARADRDERLAAMKLASQMHYGQIIERLRQQRDAKIAAIKKHYAEQAAAKRAKAADSGARTRLLKIAKRLKNAKLPAVSRSLLNQYIGDLDTIAKSMTGRTLQKLSDLQAWYLEQKESNPDFISDPHIEKMLQRLSQRQIADLTDREVADLTDVLLNIENEIRTQKKLIDSQDRRDVYIQGVTVIEDINNSRGLKEGVIAGLDRLFVEGTLSPLREVSRLTGYNENDPLYLATKALEEGQMNMLGYQIRAEKLFRKWLDNKKFTKKIAGKNATMIRLSNGNETVAITPAMRMSLYLHSLNDQNLRHIADGGVKLPDAKLYAKGQIAEAYDRGKRVRLSPSTVRKITAGMTAQERSFALAAYKYFNGMSRDAINETSEKLKGYSLADVENYFPIQTDSNFLRDNFDTIKNDGSLEGMGFLKERVNAATPILLLDLNTVLTRSIAQHAKYYGLAIPVRNFNKLWDVTTRNVAENGDVTRYVSSVQEALTQKWGGSAGSYIKKMLRDLQNPSTNREQLDKTLSKLRSNYAQAVLTLNLSVAMKQAASYPTAAAVVGYKPLSRAMADFGKVNLDLIEKYTPLQAYRSRGFSSQELGDIASQKGQLPEILNWIQGVDLLTTRKLWKAAEYYIRQENKNLKIGTDEYYIAVRDVYNRIITETQPNYTTMERPQYLRSESSMLQNVLMFKTQPFQNFNILYGAFGNLDAKRRAYRTSGTEESKAAYQTAKKQASRAVTSQLLSLAVFAAMSAAWNLIRGRDDKYKDEEGNVTVGSIASGIGQDMIGGAFGMIPFGSDLWEFANSMLSEEKYYGFEAVTASAVNDLANAMLKGSKAIKNVLDGGTKDLRTLGLQMDSVAKGVSKIVGIPYENVENVLKIIYLRTAQAVSGNYFGKYAYLRMTSLKDGDCYDNLYSAMNHDTDAYQDVYAAMVRDGFDPEKIKDAMEERMKEAQGVTKVSELKQRYLAPEDQKVYDRTASRLKASKTWKSANQEQRDDVLDLLYQLASGSEASSAKKAREDIEGGTAAGLTRDEYLQYRLALSIADEPNKNGNYKTYTNEEVEAALNMTGLTQEEKAYLWEAAGKSATTNPW